MTTTTRYTPTTQRSIMGRIPAFLGLAKSTGGLYAENTEGMTINQALTAAGLDFTVEAVKDVSVTTLTDNGVTTVTHPDYRMNVARHTDGTITPVGMTKGRYQIVQNTDAYAFAEILLGAGGANIVAAGAYGNPHGSRTYLALALNPFDVQGDPHQMYVTILNSHDGSTGLVAALAPIRLYCTNQTNATFGRKAPQRISLRHTASIEGHATEAREVLGLAEQWEINFQKAAEQLLHTPMTSDRFIEYTDKLWTPPKDEDAKRAVTLHANRQDTLHQLFAQDPSTGTAYAGYQAVTEYLDWYGPVRGSDSPEIARYTRTLDDTSNIKPKAWSLLTASVL